LTIYYISFNVIFRKEPKEVLVSTTQTTPPAKTSIRPLTSQAELNKIRKLLRNRSRDALLFELAIATGIQAKQLAQLKTGDIKAWAQGLVSGILGDNRESNTSRNLPAEARTAIEQYLDEFSPNDDEFVFKSRKGQGPLTVASVSRLVSGWFKKTGLEGLSGFLSLRKTWEFHYTPSKKSRPKQSNESQSKPKAENNLKPVHHPTINEAVYKRLEEAVIYGQIPPGTRLVAVKLAAQMRVSTIPVREALARLAARDFITITPQKGAIVNERSVEGIIELLEVRQILESAALKKSFHLIQPSTLAMLEKTNEVYTVAWRYWDVDEMLKAAKKFHDLLYRDADITVLKKMIDQVWDSISPYYHIMFKQQKGPLHTGAAYHQEIIEGIRSQEPDRAVRSLTKDLEEAKVYVAEALTKMQSRAKSDLPARSFAAQSLSKLD